MTNFIKVILGFVVAVMLSACASDAPKNMKVTNIAILMPITGQNAQLGQRLASMVELGLGDGLEGNIKVMTYDVAEESRIPMIVNKMKARGTMLVLGPIFSANAQVIIPQIEPYGITMITLSNNPALASSNVYVFGHAPMKQTQRMMGYMLDKGYKEYMMLLPASKYSSEMTAVVANMVAEKGGKLVQSEFYSDKQESIELAVQNIANAVQNINELDDASNKPVLYISDDSALLQRVVAALKEHNLDVGAVIVGDDKLDSEHDQSLAFLFTGSMQAHSDDLASRAQNIIGTKYLNYLDLAAYDLGKITAYNLGQGLARDQFLARLNSGHVYIGASGSIKFVSGVADRKYDIIKRDSNGYSLVDAAK